MMDWLYLSSHHWIGPLDSALVQIPNPAWFYAVVFSGCSQEVTGDAVRTVVSRIYSRCVQECISCATTSLARPQIHHVAKWINVKLIPRSCSRRRQTEQHHVGGA